MFLFKGIVAWVVAALVGGFGHGSIHPWYNRHKVPGIAGQQNQKLKQQR